MSGASGAPATTRAWVLFGGGGGLWWLGLLKPGFRHCLALMNDGRHWLLVDPLSSHTEVTVLDADAGWDVPGWYRDQGLTVVPAVTAAPPRRPAPWAPFTCVEAVKRLIGLHDPLVVTPWQLHRRLTCAAALSGPTRSAPTRRGFPSMANLFKAPKPSAAATPPTPTPTPAPTPAPAPVPAPMVNTAPTGTAPSGASNTAPATAPTTDPPWWATTAPAVADSAPTPAASAPTPAPAAAKPVPATAAPVSPATADGAASDPATADLQDTAKAAEELLQRRSRSQAGTVQTSWRGVLGLNDLMPLRKRLLGE